MPFKIGANSQNLFVILLLMLGLAIVVMSIELGFGTMKQPAGGFYPFFTGALMLFFGSLVLRSQVKKPQATPVFQAGGLRRYLLILSALVVWLVLLDSAGFLLATFLTTLAIARIMGLEGWRWPLAVAVGTVLFTYLLFEVWFYTDLPRGVLG